jgi:methylated-DNA-[protein]-cysteine S-methyltransferase
MRCRSALTRIDAMRTGELQPDESHVLHDHLEHCPSCNESVADVEILASLVRDLKAAPPRSCIDSVKGKCASSFDQIDDIWVAFSKTGLRMIHRGGSEDEFRERFARRYSRPLERAPLPEKLRKQVTAALRGEGAGEPLVDWGEEATELEREVLGTLNRIPRGEVRTYAWVARQIGRPKAVRAVGNILAKNFVPIVVPCHRVIPSSGGIGNYAFGSAAKRELLRREGVDVDSLEALEREGVRYIGSKTTKIVCFPTCKDARRIREENRVPFRAEDDAVKKGFRPCMRCQPFAA